MKGLSKTDHIAMFYDSPEERIHFLADYYNEGLEANELCVFVTLETPPEVAVQALTDAGLKDAQVHIANHDLQIFAANDTYFTDGEFVAAYMLKNVENFLEDAEKQGYDGLRTAGEMNWLADHPESHSDAAHYESDINGVSGGIKFTGLCLYSTQELPDNVIHGALQTHPEVVYHNQQQGNPYYSLA
jgi:hypothetical protein